MAPGIRDASAVAVQFYVLPQGKTTLEENKFTQNNPTLRARPTHAPTHPRAARTHGANAGRGWSGAGGCV